VKKAIKGIREIKVTLEKRVKLVQQAHREQPLPIMILPQNSLPHLKEKKEIKEIRVTLEKQALQVHREFKVKQAQRVIKVTREIKVMRLHMLTLLLNSLQL